MLTLGIHPGYHDAVAVVFDDYRMLAGVQLERLTRIKIDGGRLPYAAVDECLSIAGASRADVDAISLGRAAFPSRYYTHLTIPRRAERAVRITTHREKHKSMERELVRARRTDGAGIFDAPRFLAEAGFANRQPFTSSTITMPTHCRACFTPIGTIRCCIPPTAAATTFSTVIATSETAGSSRDLVGTKACWSRCGSIAWGSPMATPPWRWATR